MTPPPSITSLLESLERYPDWVLVAGATVLAVVLIWILAKLLKWGLYLLMWVVLIGGIAATLWLLFEGTVAPPKSIRPDAASHHEAAVTISAVPSK